MASRALRPVGQGRSIVLTAIGLLMGCTGFQLPPLATGHPANPDAPTTPLPPRSQTLMYGASDVPSSQPRPALASAHEKHGSTGGQAPSGQIVEGVGQVIATTPRTSQLVLDHEEIKGFMEAMTMGYRVDPPSLLEGLQAGDKVRFTIDVQRKAIVKVEKLP